MYMLNACVVFCALLAVCAASVSGDAGAGDENIALGCRVTFDTPPNYPLCTDGEDALQITDGEYCEGAESLWAQKPTVGWAGMSPFMFTIDLGKTQPIGGASFSTAAGFAGVGWPASILVFTSEDNRNWRAAGDIVRLAARNGLPEPNRYSAFRYVTHELRARGRYVKIAIITQTGSYAFTDEVEVYLGPDSIPAPPPDEAIIPDVPAYISRTCTLRGGIGRLVVDLASARKAVEGSSIDDSRKLHLLARLDEAEKEIAVMPSFDQREFRAIFPLNEVHARVLSVYAPVMRSRSLPAFFAWRKHRYDPVSPTEFPGTAPKTPVLSIEMMRNERRADAFLLTNASDKPAKVTLSVEGLPGAPNPRWLRVSSVPWTDTPGGVAIAAALPEAEFAGGGYRSHIPAGMTRKIWLEADSSMLRAGSYHGSVVVKALDKTIAVPFAVRVSSVRMSRPRLSLAVWDYTDAKAAYGINDGNRASCIKLMRSHYVDSPWAGASSLPLPGAEDFDAGGQLKAPLDFRTFDRWVKLWPGARNYFVFLSVAGGLAGTEMGSPEFNARVGSWARAVADHVGQLGLKPGQLALLLVDEPYSDSQDEIIAAWARAIKASGAGIAIFEDPAWDRPDLTKIQDAITLSDMLCPGLGAFCSGPQQVRDYFARLQAEGRKLWFYQCDGPVKAFDPHRYYRMQAWYAFRYGAAGIAWWAFGDIGGASSSWNEYTAASAPFSPAFIAPDGATDGVHWQAVMEGVQDHEYLAMLRDAAARSKDEAFKSEADDLVAEVFTKMTPGYGRPYHWAEGVDREMSDEYRLRVLALLEKAE